MTWVFWHMLETQRRDVSDGYRGPLVFSCEAAALHLIISLTHSLTDWLTYITSRASCDANKQVVRSREEKKSRARERRKAESRAEQRKAWRAQLSTPPPTRHLTLPAGHLLKVMLKFDIDKRIFNQFLNIKLSSRRPHLGEYRRLQSFF